MFSSKQKILFTLIGVLCVYVCIFWLYYFSQVIIQPYVSYRVNSELVEIYRASFYTNLILGTFISTVTLMLNLIYVWFFSERGFKVIFPGTIALVGFLVGILFLLSN